jgi:hypothetical protein
MCRNQGSYIRVKLCTFGVMADPPRAALLAPRAAPFLLTAPFLVDRCRLLVERFLQLGPRGPVAPISDAIPHERDGRAGGHERENGQRVHSAGENVQREG